MTAAGVGRAGPIPDAREATPGEHPERPYDFRQLDFERLWKGREPTIALETAVVSRALASAPGSRVLEVGPGGGRITPTLRRRFQEYVGVDVTVEFLQRLAERDAAPDWLLAADVHHLPFEDAAFDAAVVIRVYNFLVDPDRALRELARVLVPGGHLLLSYHPYPSIATAFDQLGRALRRPVSSPRDAGTTGPRPPERPELPTRRSFAAALARSGFETVREFATGLEDSRFGRWVPTSSYLAISEILVRGPIAPQLFVLARKPGKRSGPISPVEEILACPACGRAYGRLSGPPVEGLSCAGCGQRVPLRGTILDFRGIPTDGYGPPR